MPVVTQIHCLLAIELAQIHVSICAYNIRYMKVNVLEFEYAFLPVLLRVKENITQK